MGQSVVWRPLRFPGTETPTPWTTAQSVLRGYRTWANPLFGSPLLRTLSPDARVLDHLDVAQYLGLARKSKPRAPSQRWNKEPDPLDERRRGDFAVYLHGAGSARSQPMAVDQARDVVVGRQVVLPQDVAEVVARLAGEGLAPKGDGRHGREPATSGG